LLYSKIVLTAFFFVVICRKTNDKIDMQHENGNDANDSKKEYAQSSAFEHNITVR
jgi:hypothetical protein